MGIASYKPEAEGPITPYTPQTAEETYKGIVADNHQTPIPSLVQYLEGRPWTVDYFSQLVAEHNNLEEIDPGKNAAYQQYQKIFNLELRVESPLSPSYDQETGRTTTTGTALILHVLPNVSDYFVSDAGSRQFGLFRVTSLERLTFNNKSVYRINYTLVNYISPSLAEWTDLEKKVVRSYYFNKNRVIEGLTPILRKEEHELVSQVHDYFESFTEAYFRKFFNRTQMTLVVPGQPTSVYDSWLVQFLFKIIDTSMSPLICEMKVLSTDNERYMDQPQLWTMLEERNYEMLNYINQKVTLVHRSQFRGSSFLRGATYNRADHYVYPIVRNLDVMTGDDPFPLTSSGEALYNPRFMTEPDLALKNIYVKGTGSYSLIKSVLNDDFYVLSRDFYEKTSDLSVLEVLIKDYLKGQTLDLDMLTALVRAYDHWPVLEQFYYGPLLMLLMKEVVRGLYP